MHFLLSFFTALLIMVGPSLAKDEGLYQPKPPPGTTFVRFFNTTGEIVSVNIGGKSYKNIPPLTASPYLMQSQGPVEFKTGLKSVAYKMDADSFYTVIADGDGDPLLHKDAVAEDPTKAMIVLYNLESDNPLTLRAQDGLVTVVENVKKGESGYRGINGVKVVFTLTDTLGASMFTFEPVVLERGRTYSIFYVGKQAVMIRGETDTTR